MKISLLKIIHQGSSHIIQKWPPVKDYDIIKRLIELTSINTQSTSVDQLKEDILRKLDICQKNIVNSVLELPFEREQIIQQYQDISSISQLRQLLFDVNQDNLLHKQQDCQGFLQQIESQKDRNTELLQNLLKKCENIKNPINFEYPNAIKQTLLSFIDEINFFDDQIIHQNQSSLTGDNNSTDKIDIVMNLISNKSNYCSDSFLLSLKQLFKKMNPIIEQLSFDNIFKESKKPIDFSLINTEQLNSIDDYVNHSILLNSNNSDYKNSVKNSIKTKIVNNLVKNQFNFTHPSFNQQFEKFIIDYYPFLNKVDFNQIFKDRNKFDFFRVLPDETLEDLFLLTQKRKELEQNNNFIQSQTQNIKNDNQMINSHFKKEEIDKLFKKYPIFDLLETLQQYKPNIQLYGTNYNNNYQNIVINQIQKSQYEVQLKEGGWAQCILDLILEKDKKYIFRFRTDGIENSLKLFFIGLIQNKNISVQSIKDDKLCCYLELENNLIKKRQDTGIDKQMKGNGFSQGSYIIEMRVCLKDQIVQLLDYPYYNYKLGLNDNQKQKLHNYSDLRVCIGLYHTNFKITLIDSLIVEKYVD